MIGEIVLGSVIANMLTGTNITNVLVDFQQLNSALSAFKTELTSMLEELREQILISRKIQLLSTLPNAQYDMNYDVLAIPTTEHKLFVIDCKNFDILVYDADNSRIKFNDRLIDPSLRRTIKLKTIDFTIEFDEAGQLVRTNGILPESRKDYPYSHYLKEVCTKHNRTRLRQLLACKQRRAQDRREMRKYKELIKRVENELALYFPDDYFATLEDVLQRPYLERLFIQQTIGYYPYIRFFTRLLCDTDDYTSTLVRKYNKSACKNYITQAIRQVNLKE